jgi:hypothetical protein
MVWDGYVVLAGDLLGQESEAAKRSAVSRAYYGAFNAARRRLEAQGMTIENQRAHDRVWRAFRVAEQSAAGTAAKSRMVGELGAGLNGLRNLADYADDVPGLDKRAVWAVAIAGRVLTLLDELEFT